MWIPRPVDGQMRRFHSTKLLRLLVATVAALASFGSQGTYAHSHRVAEGVHHDHDAGDHHDDDHHGPGLTDGVSHVHGSWLGFAFTRSTIDWASDDRLWPSEHPTLSGDLGRDRFGPFNERVPWLEVFIPPEPFPFPARLGRSSPYPHVYGVRISHALAGRVLVLLC